MRNREPGCPRPRSTSYGSIAVLFGCPSAPAPTNNPFCEQTTRGAAPGSTDIICCGREVAELGRPEIAPTTPQLHPNYTSTTPQVPPNYTSTTPQLHPNNPKTPTKTTSAVHNYPPTTPPLHPNYTPTTPQPHPNNPKTPIKTTSAMHQAPLRPDMVLRRWYYGLFHFRVWCLQGVPEVSLRCP